MLGARDEDARASRLEVYKEVTKKVKRCIYQSKEEVQEQFGRKMNQDVNVNSRNCSGRRWVRRMEERWRIPTE